MDKLNKKETQFWQQICNHFVKKYNEIEASDLSEIDKKASIDTLLKYTKHVESSMKYGRELTDIGKEILGMDDYIEETQEHKPDTNVIETLVDIYTRRAKMPKKEIIAAGKSISKGIALNNDKILKNKDTKNFEKELRALFTENYESIIGENSDFLSIVVGHVRDPYEYLDELPLEVAYDYTRQDVLEREEFEINRIKNAKVYAIAQNNGINPDKFTDFGVGLIVEDGLVAQEEGDFSVFHSTPEAIKRRINELNNRELYYTLKDDTDNKSHDKALKDSYIEYAKEHNIQLESSEKNVSPIDVEKRVKGIKKNINKSGLTLDNLEEMLRYLKSEEIKLKGQVKTLENNRGENEEQRG